MAQAPRSRDPRPASQGPGIPGPREPRSLEPRSREPSPPPWSPCGPSIAPVHPRAAARMTQHVLELAGEHDIQVTWVRTWRNAIAFHEPTHHAYVPEIRRPSDYLFALHELGHVASDDALGLWDHSDKYSTVLCEGAAWAWASAQAKAGLLRHMRKADWDRVAYAYRTYLALPPTP